MDAVEKDDLDLDAGRHLDDGLVLFGAFDEVSAKRAAICAQATEIRANRRRKLIVPSSMFSKCSFCFPTGFLRG
ncbi:MAG: hypothetical protein EVA34_13910 [Erythrobacter sp.]|nr:MAG: hypothetical protein EVA34_13910 [Erythrobacter sp.]